jgi:transcriptional antiterminator RfaH
MTAVDASAWYVVHTQMNAEMKAARNLLRQGFDIYLPKFLKRRSHARKVEKVAAPLFPRYLFVCVDITAQRWRSIQSTFGVSHFVSNGPSPTPVAGNVLRLLKAREDANGFIQLDQRPKFVPGEKVRVLSGPFSDNLALFDGMGDRDRVAILLDLLGRKVRVSIDVDMIVAAAG